MVTITIHDDLNSDYGFHKASISLRDSRDTMFFAGPCTGGSSWARLNRTRRPRTEEIIEAKVLIFRQLWGRFEILFVAFHNRCIGIYSELPRGCQYWKNEEVRFMIEGTESTIHDFDGCCYGLRQRFGDSNMYIKKPWRIVSWNVDLEDRLSLKCDGRHERAPCAGKETLHTQIYTSKIVSIVLQEQHRRSPCANNDSSNVRSVGSKGNKPVKCVVAVSCVALNESTSNHQRDDHRNTCRPGMFDIAYFTNHSKKAFARRLRWILSSWSAKRRYLNSGLSSSGAAGAGCARSSDGHKSCSDAMAASGSSNRPQTADDKASMFLLGRETNGARYLKATGEIMRSLRTDEDQGRLTLPPRFGEGIAATSLVEGWSAYGIPIVVLTGLALGEVSTDKDRLIPVFRAVVRLVRISDMDLDFKETAFKMRRLCQAICVATEQYTERGGENDVHSMGPTLARLATAQALRAGGPGIELVCSD